MVQQFTLADSLSLGDLHTYLQRAGRADDGSVRLVAGGGIRAVYTAILYPRGILDESPTVLGLRTFALFETEDFDASVADMEETDAVAYWSVCDARALPLAPWLAALLDLVYASAAGPPFAPATWRPSQAAARAG